MSEWRVIRPQQCDAVVTGGPLRSNISSTEAPKLTCFPALRIETLGALMPQSVDFRERCADRPRVSPQEYTQGENPIYSKARRWAHVEQT